jgi:hypothetical protein
MSKLSKLLVEVRAEVRNKLHEEYDFLAKNWEAAALWKKIDAAGSALMDKLTKLTGGGAEESIDMGIMERLPERLDVIQELQDKIDGLKEEAHKYVRGIEKDLLKSYPHTAETRKDAAKLLSMVRQLVDLI